LPFFLRLRLVDNERTLLVPINAGPGLEFSVIVILFR
jgi:hypothetical protein